MQPYREDQHQQDREPEIRHREADLARRHHHEVAALAAPFCGEDAGRKRNDAGQRHGEERERRAHRETIGDQGADRRIISIGETEVAAGEAGEPGQIARRERLVETELVGEGGDRLRRRACAEHHLSGVAGKDLEHAKNDQRGEGQGRDEKDDALNEVESHGSFSNTRR
jgi:hypothetical protein